jgi:hypothetical protein
VLDLLPTMGQFRGKDHVPGRIIDQGHPRRLAARINLEPERVHVRVLHRALQDDREGISFEHRGLA